MTHKNGTSSISFVAIVPIALMLFSMLFGAGNLIFPPVLGAHAGQSFTPAITGFLIGGVALPVITIIAVALSGQDILSLTARGGKIFAVGFSMAVYLSIGAFFAIPRTGAVSFATAISPITGWESTFASVIFNLIFFGVSFLLAINPQGMVDNLGKILTPMLLVLLALLVIISMISLPNNPAPAIGEYATSPLSAGLFEGYMTMDSIASLAFGIVVISAIRRKQTDPHAPILKATSIAAIISGVLLGLIYLGLGAMGMRMPEAQSFDDGATLLSAAALETLGFPGQIVFGGIVLLACLTTAVGLLVATSQFFETLVPKVNYTMWLTLFAITSFIFASAGLETVLSIAVPIIIVLYPIAITLVAVTIFSALTKLPIFFGFRFGVWAAAAWSVTTAAAPQLLAWAPLQAANFGWVIPVAIVFAIGLGIDLSKRDETLQRLAALKQTVA